MGLMGMLAKSKSRRDGRDEMSPNSSSPGLGSGASRKDFEMIISEAISGSVDIDWALAKHLIDAVKPEERPLTSTVKDMVKALKGFLSSTNSNIAIKTILIMDLIFFMADVSFAQYLGESKNMRLLVDIATKSLEPLQRNLMTQVLVDWAHKYAARPDVCAPFHMALSTLRGKHLSVPPPSSVREPGQMPPMRPPGGGQNQEGFAIPAPYHPGSPSPGGVVYQQPSPQPYPAMQFTPSSPGDMMQQSVQMSLSGNMDVLAQTAAIERETNAFCQQQIHAMLVDIRQLNAALEVGGQAAASRGDEIWDAADRCMRWQKIIEDMLLQDLDEVMMMTVLHANDTLNVALRKWDLSSPQDFGEDEEFNASLPGESPNNQALFSMDDDDNTPGPRHRRTESGGESMMPFGGMMGGGDSEVQQLRSELASTKSELTVAEKRVADAAGRMRDLLRANAQLEEEREAARHAAEQAEAQLRAGGGEGSDDDDFHKAVAAAEAMTLTDQQDQQLEWAQDQAKEAQKQMRVLQSELEAMGSLKYAAEKELRVAKEAQGALEIRLMELDAKATAAVRTAEEMKTQVAQAGMLVQRAETAEKKLLSAGLELKKESVLRKKSMNELRALKGNIRVCARVRPITAGGNAKEDASIGLERMDEYTLQVETNRNTAGGGQAVVHKYEYDQCFPQSSSQESVYEEAKDLLQSCLDGFNVCLFAYGQTGSGKTHTMLGSPGSDGVIPRFINDLYHWSEVSGGLNNVVTVRAYMLELYQDQLIDLLMDPSETAGKKLEIKRDPSTGIVHVQGAALVSAESPEALRAILDKGLTRRKTASTKMNDTSSRSHLIFSVLVQNHVPATNATTMGKMTFVDLAGSERVNRSGAIDDETRLNEAKAINKSLSALGDVVQALTTNQQFVPYRNHKLTQLMADSLGGNSKCCMIVNVSPLASDADESRNSLDYASRVKNVTNEASKSLETQIITKLTKEIEKLKSQLGKS